MGFYGEVNDDLFVEGRTTTEPVCPGEQSVVITATTTQAPAIRAEA